MRGLINLYHIQLLAASTVLIEHYRVELVAKLSSDQDGCLLASPGGCRTSTIRTAKPAPDVRRLFFFDTFIIVIRRGMRAQECCLQWSDIRLNAASESQCIGDSLSLDEGSGK